MQQLGMVFVDRILGEDNVQVRMTPLCHPHPKATLKRPQKVPSITQQISLSPISCLPLPHLVSRSYLVTSVSILIPGKSKFRGMHTSVGSQDFNPRSATSCFGDLGQVT